MLFLIVLLVATVATAAIAPRSGVRTWARGGLAGAFVVAGVAHLVQPTPFEQHLPEWVPAVRALVYATGAIEIALGVALAVWTSRRELVGWVVAGYLVTVVPANIYVAVADVDVDGQPGGAYPWIRVPFQALFVVWALWSTRDPAARPVALTLPWARGPAHRTIAPSTTTVTVMASRLELRHLRNVPGFLSGALRIRRTFRGVDGAVALALRTVPWRRSFWTLSVWDDDDSLQAFVEHPVHRAVTTRYASRMAGSRFVTWTAPAAALPDWTEAFAHLEEHLVEHPSETDVPARPTLLEV